jgi:DnaJ-class molecular chaperone
VSTLAPAEIRALSRILEELDYYQLLHVEPAASAQEIRSAYHACSRSFHPDRHREVEAELQQSVDRIAKRVSEAYSVLRHPARRRAYDEQLAAGRGTRIQLAAAEASGKQLSNEIALRSPQGRQFYSRVQADLARGDVASAIRNLKTALTFEAGNSTLRALLGELTRRRS